MRKNIWLLLAVFFSVMNGFAFADDYFDVPIEASGKQGVQVKLMSPAFANVFFQDDEVEFWLSMHNALDVEQEMFGYFAFSDVRGRTLDIVRKSFLIPARGEGKVKVAFNTDQYGFFTLQGSVFSEQSDGEDIAFTTTLARVRKQINIDEDSIFGLCTPLQRYDQKLRSDCINLLSKLGVSSTREDVFWEGVKKFQGQYQMTPAQADYIPKLKANHIKILPILCYGNPIYRGKITDHADAYGRYSGFVAKSVSPYTDHIEVWNEWNGAFGTGGINSPVEYTKMLKAASKAVKAAAPQLKVVGCSTAVTDHAWIEEVFKAGGGDSMDAVSIHPYRYPVSPEASGLVADLNKVLAVINKYGGNQTVWCTETGYPVNENFSGLKSAKYMVRFYLSALSVPRVEKINWFCWESKPGSSGSWSMVTEQYAPMEAVPAYATMTYNLVGSKFKESLPLKQHQYLFHFERGAEHIYALWSEEGFAGQVSLRTDNPVTAMDMWGNSYELTPQSGQIKVTANDEVLFLHSAVPLKAVVDADIFAGQNKVVVGQELSFTYQDPLLQKAKAELDSLPGGWKGKLAQRGDALELSLLAGKEVKPGRYPLRLLLTESKKTCGLFDLTFEVSPKVSFMAKPVWENGEAVGELSLSNNTPEAVNLTVKIGGDTMWPGSFGASELQVALAGYEERRINFELPASLTTVNQVSKLQILAVDEHGQIYQYQRPFALLYAKSAPGKISIDGDLGEWDQSAGVKIERWHSNGGKRGDGYQGRLYINWDDENLYMGVEVDDKIHYQGGTGGDIWGGDSIQFAMDPFRMQEKEIFGLEDGWYEYGGALTKDGPITWMWIVTMGAIPGKVFYFNFDIKRTGGKTIYEYEIPWNTVAFFKPEVGAYLGFGVCVNQNDGERRAGWLSYCEGIASIDKSADMFADLILIK